MRQADGLVHVLDVLDDIERFLAASTAGPVRAGDEIRLKGDQLFDRRQQLGEPLVGFRRKQLERIGVFFIFKDFAYFFHKKLICRIAGYDLANLLLCLCFILWGNQGFFKSFVRIFVMDIALITGSSGLIGSEAAQYFAQKGFRIVGIDNDMRRYFFGEEASTVWNKEALEERIKDYVHMDLDIRDREGLRKLFEEYKAGIKLIIHAAAQPSHDWAANEPLTDFEINATGTLNLLEMTRLHCPGAVFIFTSTNKVYGDLPNALPLVEEETRWELAQDHPFYDGIDESMSIDQSKHSLFGASKAAADILVQEYGRYFQMKTACFRGGCLTGPNHSGAQLHGFLAYLMKCCVTGEEYTVFGYKGKQVRDNIHSYDLVTSFDSFFQNPRSAEVYNIGGGRPNSCSMLEAISTCEKISGKKMNHVYSEENRIGDHIWYISHLGKFQSHYPGWQQKYSLEDTLRQIYENNVAKWEKA